MVSAAARAADARKRRKNKYAKVGTGGIELGEHGLGPELNEQTTDDIGLGPDSDGQVGDDRGGDDYDAVRTGDGTMRAPNGTVISAEVAESAALSSPPPTSTPSSPMRKTTKHATDRSQWETKEEKRGSPRTAASRRPLAAGSGRATNRTSTTPTAEKIGEDEKWAQQERARRLAQQAQRVEFFQNEDDEDDGTDQFPRHPQDSVPPPDSCGEREMAAAVRHQSRRAVVAGNVVLAERGSELMIRAQKRRVAAVLVRCAEKGVEGVSADMAARALEESRNRTGAAVQALIEAKQFVHVPDEED